MTRKKTSPAHREPLGEKQPKSSGDYTPPRKQKDPPKYTQMKGSRGTAGTQSSARDFLYQPPPPSELKQPTPVVNSDRPVNRTLFSNGKIVTIAELASMFRISERTLWRRVVQQEWPRIPLGRQVRFDLELVLRHIERVERYDQPPPLLGVTMFFDTVFPALEGSHTYVVQGESFVFPGKYIELRSIGELVTSDPPRWVDVEVWADERVVMSMPRRLHSYVLDRTPDDSDDAPHNAPQNDDASAVGEPLPARLVLEPLPNSPKENPS